MNKLECKEMFHGPSSTTFIPPKSKNKNRFTRALLRNFEKWMIYSCMPFSWGKVRRHFFFSFQAGEFQLRGVLNISILIIKRGGECGSGGTDSPFPILLCVPTPFSVCHASHEVRWKPIVMPNCEAGSVVSPFFVLKFVCFCEVPIVLLTVIIAKYILIFPEVVSCDQWRQW